MLILYKNGLYAIIRHIIISVGKISNFPLLSAEAEKWAGFAPLMTLIYFHIMTKLLYTYCFSGSYNFLRVNLKAAL